MLAWDCMHAWQACLAQEARLASLHMQGILKEQYLQVSLDSSD